MSTRILDPTTLYLTDHLTKEHTFTLDGIFHQRHDNHAIFTQAVLPLARNVLTGINSTVFAYGITGAGKSYTMFGNTAISDQELDCKAGIIPRTLQCLLSSSTASNLRLRLSYLEIYNEQVYDLLAASQVSLQIS